MLAGRLPEAVKTTFLAFLSQTLLVESSNIAHQLKDFPHGVDHSHLNALLAGYLTLGKAGLLKPALKVCRRHVENCRYVTLWREGGRGGVLSTQQWTCSLCVISAALLMYLPSMLLSLTYVTRL